MRKVLVIFGFIEFLEGKAIVHTVEEAALLPEDVAEKLASKAVYSNVHDGYIIPQIYKNPIEFAQLTTYTAQKEEI